MINDNIIRIILCLQEVHTRGKFIIIGVKMHVKGELNHIKIFIINHTSFYILN